MSIEVTWDNEQKTVIRYAIDSPWNWEDIRAAAETSNKMLDEVGHKVHFIYDMQKSNGVPDGALTNLRRFIGTEHPLTGQSILVGTSKNGVMLLARSILGMAQRIYKADWRFLFADTLDEARQKLAQLPQEANSP